MKVIDKIKQLNKYELTEFLCAFAEEHLQRAVKSINDKFGSNLVSMVVTFDKAGIRDYLDEEF